MFGEVKLLVNKENGEACAMKEIDLDSHPEAEEVKGRPLPHSTPSFYIHSPPTLSSPTHYYTCPPLIPSSFIHPSWTSPQFTHLCTIHLLPPILSLFHFLTPPPPQPLPLNKFLFTILPLVRFVWLLFLPSWRLFSQHIYFFITCLHVSLSIIQFRLWKKKSVYTSCWSIRILYSATEAG